MLFFGYLYYLNSQRAPTQSISFFRDRNFPACKIIHKSVRSVTVINNIDCQSSPGSETLIQLLRRDFAAAASREVKSRFKQLKFFKKCLCSLRLKLRVLYVL